MPINPPFQSCHTLLRKVTFTSCTNGCVSNVPSSCSSSSIIAFCWSWFNAVNLNTSFSFVRDGDFGIGFEEVEVDDVGDGGGGADTGE